MRGQKSIAAFPRVKQSPPPYIRYVSISTDLVFSPHTYTLILLYYTCIRGERGIKKRWAKVADERERGITAAWTSTRAKSLNRCFYFLPPSAPLPLLSVRAGGSKKLPLLHGCRLCGCTLWESARPWQRTRFLFVLLCLFFSLILVSNFLFGLEDTALFFSHISRVNLMNFFSPLFENSLFGMCPIDFLSFA